MRPVYLMSWALMTLTGLSLVERRRRNARAGDLDFLDFLCLGRLKLGRLDCRGLLRLCDRCRQTDNDAGVERVHDGQRQLFPVHPFHIEIPQRKIMRPRNKNKNDSRCRKQVAHYPYAERGSNENTRPLQWRDFGCCKFATHPAVQCTTFLRPGRPKSETKVPVLGHGATQHFGGGAVGFGRREPWDGQGSEGRSTSGSVRARTAPATCADGNERTPRRIALPSTNLDRRMT